MTTSRPLHSASQGGLALIATLVALSLLLALALPFAAVAILAVRRHARILVALLVVPLLVISMRPQNVEKRPFVTAGKILLTESGEGARIATWLTPRIPYYAKGEDVKLQRLLPELRHGPVDPSTIRAAIEGRADWLALVPGRLPDPVREALLAAAAGLPTRRVGEGEYTVHLFRLTPPVSETTPVR